MSEGPAKHRWFRFSLRTMFVVMAIACWIGWQVYVVQKRKQFIDELNRPSMTRIIMSNVAVIGTSETLQSAPELDPQVPIFRRWIGDRPRENILVESLDDANTAMRWFPEASVELYRQTSPAPRTPR